MKNEKFVCADEPGFVEDESSRRFLERPKTLQQMLEANRTPLEIRWSVFLSAWGIPYHFGSEYSEHQSSRKPSFFLPRNGLWMEIRDGVEADEFEDWLDYFAPLVASTRRPAVILFGPPKVRLPQGQGWGLRIEGDELIAMPIHLAECPHCGGFNLVGVGGYEEQQAHPGLMRKIEQLIQTEALQAAYESASHVSILQH